MACEPVVCPYNSGGQQLLWAELCREVSSGVLPHCPSLLGHITSALSCAAFPTVKENWMCCSPVMGNKGGETREADAWGELDRAVRLSLQKGGSTRGDNELM